MKKFIVAVLLLIATVAAAENQGDGSLLYRGTYVQGWSPNGLYTAVLTTSNSAAAIHDLTDFLGYGVYCATECLLRLMPTAARGTYPQTTVPAGSWLINVKNKATPFVNISGAHQWQQM